MDKLRIMFRFNNADNKALEDMVCYYITYLENEMKKIVMKAITDSEPKDYEI